MVFISTNCCRIMECHCFQSAACRHHLINSHPLITAAGTWAPAWWRLSLGMHGGGGGEGRELRAAGCKLRFFHCRLAHRWDKYPDTGRDARGEDTFRGVGFPSYFCVVSQLSSLSSTQGACPKPGLQGFRLQLAKRKHRRGKERFSCIRFGFLS